MLLKKEEIEMDFAKKQEKAVQDALKIRLHKTTCDCCKKTIATHFFNITCIGTICGNW